MPPSDLAVPGSFGKLPRVRCNFFSIIFDFVSFLPSFIFFVFFSCFSLIFKQQDEYLEEHPRSYSERYRRQFYEPKTAEFISFFRGLEKEATEEPNIYEENQEETDEA
jgi:hypothetical protein